MWCCRATPKPHPNDIDDGASGHYDPDSGRRSPVRTVLLPSSTRNTATLSGIAAIGLWSSLALLATLTSQLPPFQVLATCFGVAAIAGTLWLAPRRACLRALRQPWPSFALTLGALFGYHALYLLAFRNAPAVEANLINYLWPSLIVLFAAVLLRTRLRAGQIAGTVSAFVGVLLLVTRGEALSFRVEYLGGYLAALSAAVLWALYSVLNRRFASVPSAAIIGPCAAVAVLALATHLIFETSVMPTPLQWLALLAMGLGPTGAAFLLWDRGTKFGDLPLLGTLSYAAPLLSTLSLLAIGQGEPQWTQAVAIGLLLAGVALSAGGPREARNGAADEVEPAA